MKTFLKYIPKSKILNFIIKITFYLFGLFIFLNLKPYLTFLNIFYVMFIALLILMLFILHNLIYVFYLNKFLLSKDIEINRFVPKFTRNELIGFKKASNEHISRMLDIYVRGTISLIILLPFLIILNLVLVSLN